MAEAQKRNATLVVGTSPVVACRNISQGQKTVIVLTNVSTAAQVISLSFGGQAVAGSSVVLYVGSSWVESIESAFTPTNDMITAIASAANGTLAVHERIMGTGL